MYAILCILYIAMKTLAGLRKASRLSLASLLRNSKGTITVEQAAVTLGIPSAKAAQLLARLSKQGWLSRIRRGLYVPIPIEAQSADVPIEDPWIIANRIYSPCYIGGWSAAEHWGLTEQIFRAVLVLTSKKVRDRNPEFKGVPFVVRTVRPNALFGLKTVWRGTEKVFVSDPTRTIVDLMDSPKLGGGITSTVEMLQTYLASKDFNASSLLDYIDKLGNRAIYKRLGFLLGRFAPAQSDLIAQCHKRISKGTSSLDPTLKPAKMVTAWHLWVPKGWEKASD